LRLPLTRTTALLKETFGYDANGLLTSYSQEDVLTGSPDFGQVRSWSYGYTTLASGLKVLTSINGPGTSGVSDITTLTYTAAGRLTKITDPNGVATEILAYDGFGRPSQVKDEQGFTWALSYDVEGRMVQAVFSPGTAAQETLGLNRPGFTGE
jgi:YD repeat-containing protein